MARLVGSGRHFATSDNAQGAYTSGLTGAELAAGKAEFLSSFGTSFFHIFEAAASGTNGT